MGHDAHMDGNGVRAAAGNDLLRNAAGRGRIRTPQDQPVLPFAERFFQTGNDFKHMGVLKGGVRGKICQQNNRVTGAAGKALGIGVGIIIHLPHDAANPFGRLFGNAVMSVQNLGNSGDRDPCRLGYILNSYTHPSSPPSFQYSIVFPGLKGSGKKFIDKLRKIRRGTGCRFAAPLPNTAFPRIGELRQRCSLR